MTAYPNTNGRQLATANQNAPLLSNDDIDPRIKQVARAIQIMAGKNKKGNYNLSDEAAIGAAMYQLGTGHMIGRDYAMNDKTGRMEMYRGVSRDANERGVGEVEIIYRDFTPEEERKNEIMEGDTAVAAEVTQLRAYKAAIAAGRKYTPIIGYGIVRKAEKYQTDEWSNAEERYVTLPENKWKPIKLAGGMTWYRKAQNRAYKDGLRHTPGVAASGEEVIVEGAAEIDGFQMPPEGANLSPEQAQAWVAKEAWAAPLRNDPDAAIAAGATINDRGKLQRQYDDWVFADSLCPHCGVPSETGIAQHKNACVFRTLYPKAPMLPDDVEEGEFTQADPGVELLTEAQARIITDAQREYITQDAAKLARNAAGSLSRLFPDDDMRHAFTKWAFGVESTNDLTDSQRHAAVSFVGLAKLGDDWLPSEYAIMVADAWKRKSAAPQA